MYLNLSFPTGKQQGHILFAGSLSIVMSLSKIDEKINARIVIDFTSTLKNGYTKNGVLRKARPDFIESNYEELANPFY
jgi:hypothetical protein